MSDQSRYDDEATILDAEEGYRPEYDEAPLPQGRDEPPPPTSPSYSFSLSQKRS